MKIRRAKRTATGFTLIEVLIALVVLAFGLLGLGLLQTLNLRYTKSANQRTQAVNLGGELLDMMRSNRSELAAYAMDNKSMAGVTLPKTGCATSSTMGAAANVARWQCEVREALGPETTVDVETDADNNVDLTIMWDETTLPTLTGAGKVELKTQL